MTLNSFGLPGMEIFRKLWDGIDLSKYLKKDTRLINLMKSLRQDYVLFIISNGRGVEVEKKMKYLGLDLTWFTSVVPCYDHDWIKPQPAPFLYLLEELKLRPEEVVYVGDRGDVDVDAAAAVGMKTVFVGGEHESADVSLRSVYDLEAILL